MTIDINLKPTLTTFPDRLEAAEGERDWRADRCEDAMSECASLRAKIAAMEKQGPVAWADAFGEPFRNRCEIDGVASPLYALPGAQAQNVPKAVAYLDLGTGGYMDIGTDLPDEALAALPKGRHMLGVIGTYGVDGYVPAQPAPSVPEGVAEALQRLIEKNTVSGLGSSEDALLVARYRQHLLACAPSVLNGWKEAAIAWEVCASIHREYGKDKDPFFNTRQGDFVKHANDARAMLAAAPKQEAQPAPSEQDESVRKAWARFSNELHRSPDAPYPGMSEAFELHFSQPFTDRDWHAESGTWAAAWKAAKRHGAKTVLCVPDVVMAALDNLDDYIARIEGNDRGACDHINLLRRYLLDATEVGENK